MDSNQIGSLLSGVRRTFSASLDAERFAHVGSVSRQRKSWSNQVNGKMQNSAASNPVSRVLPGLEPRPLPFVPDLLRRNRNQAEAKRLDLTIQNMEDELDRLDTVVKVSEVCNEVFGVIDEKPDPFLPITRGPENPEWNKWFDKPKKSKGRCCWL